MKELGITDYKKLQEFFDKMIQAQNLQSQSCIKAISLLLKNPAKPFDEDDVRNPIVSFQTSFPFVKADVEQFRRQHMKYECFQVLHPWAYDLDQVDFKYIISKDQVHTVCKALSHSPDAQVFWLSFFKSQLSVSADEFISALRELCLFNSIPEYFEAHYAAYKKFMVECDFSVSLALHADRLTHFISAITQHAADTHHCHALTAQLRLKNAPR